MRTFEELSSIELGVKLPAESKDCLRTKVANHDYVHTEYETMLLHNMDASNASSYEQAAHSYRQAKNLKIHRHFRVPPKKDPRTGVPSIEGVLYKAVQ